MPYPSIDAAWLPIKIDYRTNKTPSITLYIEIIVQLGHPIFCNNHLTLRSLIDETPKIG